MVGESFHQRGCRGEDDDHIRLGAMAKPSRLFVYNPLDAQNGANKTSQEEGLAPPRRITLSTGGIFSYSLVPFVCGSDPRNRVECFRAGEGADVQRAGCFD